MKSKGVIVRIDKDLAKIRKEMSTKNGKSMMMVDKEIADLLKEFSGKKKKKIVEVVF